MARFLITRECKDGSYKDYFAKSWLSALWRLWTFRNKECIQVNIVDGNLDEVILTQAWSGFSVVPPSDGKKRENPKFLPYETRLISALVDVVEDGQIADKDEVRARFTEESQELIQAAGGTFEEVVWSAMQVFSKPIDPVALEVGQVMTALHRLAYAFGVNVTTEAEKDLAHIIRNKESVKDRNRRKVRYSGSIQPLSTSTDIGDTGRKGILKRITNRFLGWSLPENFSPDNGISFEKIGNKGTQYEYIRSPVGTNLFDANQTEKLVEYLLEDIVVVESSVLSMDCGSITTEIKKV